MDENSIFVERGMKQLKMERNVNEDRFWTKMKNVRTFQKTSLDFRDRDGTWLPNCQKQNMNSSIVKTKAD